MAQTTRPKVFKPKHIDPVFMEPMDSAEPEKPAESFKDEFPVMTASTHVPVTTEVYETVILKVPQHVYDDYKKSAGAQEMTVEELMQYRLLACKNHNALRGLWFSDSERTTLENILQKWPLETASQAIGLIQRAGLIKFDALEITLTPAQRRVVSLCMYGGRTPKTFFEAMVKKELRA